MVAYFPLKGEMRFPFKVMVMSSNGKSLRFGADMLEQQSYLQTIQLPGSCL